MSNRAVTILTGSALAAGLLAGVLIGRASANDGATTAPKVEQAQGSIPDPKAYPRTKQGAATAAQAYDDALGRAAFFMTVDERRAVVDAISSNAMRDQIAKDEEQAAELFVKLFDLPKGQGQVVLRVAPLGWRVVSYTNDSARVETWTATIAGKPGAGHGVITQFTTTTIDLAFERGGWRLAGTPQKKDGPSPVADNPQASSDLLNGTKDLREFSHEAR